VTSKEITAQLGHYEHTVGKWRRRFAEHRIEGLSDEYRAGRPRTISDEQVADVIKRTLETTPKDATHWSIRSMAEEIGLSHTTIRRIWNAFGLQPHRAETFRLSTDPLFVDKVQDMVGLYMSPPNRSIVLCVDEKSQIQALDREQPVLPMAPGVAEQQNPYLYPQRHDIVVCRPRHRHRRGDREVLQTPPRDGVPRLPQGTRPQNARGAGRAYRHG
jgi:transposase